jgi:ATP-dependent helicase STH1/SNF2
MLTWFEKRAVLEAQIEEEEMEGDYTDGELNEILARGDEEFEIFQQIDIDRRRGDEAHWRAHHPAGEPMPERLIQEWELPPIYRKEFKLNKKTAQEEENELFDESGSRRKRTAAGGNVHYDDGLTEDQFLAAVEGEDGQNLQNAVAQAHARKDKKKVKKAPDAPSPLASGSEQGRGRGRPKKRPVPVSLSDEDDDLDFSDASSAPSIQNKKRGRRSTASMEPPFNDDDSDNPRKRRKTAGKNAVKSAGNEMKTAMKSVS